MPVDITGLGDTLKAMKDFDDNLYKGMNKQIKGAMIPIRDKARAYAPANSEMFSGWTKKPSSTETIKYRAFPAYDQAETRLNIIYRPGKNKRNKGTSFNVSYYVANTKSPGGAIYETAGRLSGRAGNVGDSLNPKASQQFIAKLDVDKLFGKSRNMQGRLIYRAWAEDNGRAYHAVNLAISTAVKTFNATNTTDKYSLAA